MNTTDTLPRNTMTSVGCYKGGSRPTFTPAISADPARQWVITVYGDSKAGFRHQPFEGTYEEAVSQAQVLNKDYRVEHKVGPFLITETCVRSLEAWFESYKTPRGPQLLKWTPINRIAGNDKMQLGFWLLAVEKGDYTDADGYGFLATRHQVSNIHVIPSQVAGYQFPTWATWIVWFNR